MNRWFRGSFLSCVLAVLLCACASQSLEYENGLPKVDRARTMASGKNVGDLIHVGVSNNLEGTLQLIVYKRFLGMTPQNHYVVQDFYWDTHTKVTDPYVLTDSSDLMRFALHDFDQMQISGCINMYSPEGSLALMGELQNGERIGLWFSMDFSDIYRRIVVQDNTANTDRHLPENGQSNNPDIRPMASSDALPKHCVFLREQAANMDEQPLPEVPWLAGDEIFRGEYVGINEAFSLYRIFRGVTAEGDYLVQDWYVNEDVKFSDTYVVGTLQDVIRSSFYGYLPRGIKGIHRIYYPNGVLREETPYSVSGQVEGLWQEWYDDGEKSSEGSFREGLPEGVRRAYYKSGALQYEAHYTGSKAELVMTWHENGQMKSRGSYNEQGKETGVWQKWDEHGKLVSEKRFD